MKRVVLYGGSFNPIHIGHLALANYLCEWGYTDEVWFLVTPQNPLKRDKEMLPDRERLRLVELAIGEYPRFKASDFEFGLPTPSYTVYTMEAIKKAFPSISFTLLIGADNWNLMDRWKDSERIVRENKIYIYPRYGFEVDPHALPESVICLKAPMLEISSTEIRRALKDGKSPVFFLHPSTFREIKEKGFYQ